MEIMHTDVKIVKYSKNAARHIKGSVPFGQFVIMNTIHHTNAFFHQPVINIIGWGDNKAII